MKRSTFTFLKHYAEMVLVMFAGMGVFFGLAVGLSAAVGSSYAELRDEAPGVVLFGMGFGMTAAMVWWMHRRGHSRSANRAMALSMILPTAASLILLSSGAVTELDTLVTLEHVIMFPAMLVAMLPYRSEFTRHGASANARLAAC
jgi:hypothetical protein